MLLEPVMCGRVPLSSETVVSKSCMPATVKPEAARLLLGEHAARAGCQSAHCIRPVVSVDQDGPTHSIINLQGLIRTAIAITPRNRGSFDRQVREVISLLDAIVEGQAEAMTVTAQTVFLRTDEERRECEELFRDHFGERISLTHYVLQPPCSGAALAVEAWAVGGAHVELNRHGPMSLSVGYDGIRWIHCGGIEAPASEASTYNQTASVLRGMKRELERAGGAIDDVVRTWFYQGGVTAETDGVQRYFELNRARADLYGGTRFGRALMRGQNGHVIYPASTGIGMLGRGLTAGCLALKTDRTDVELVALENPGQVPAYRYDRNYSPESPKFARAMAVLLGDYVTTWISGTASIVNSESCFPGDIECQTHQTLDNIERLIAPENFALHGVPRAGASLQDLAKVRVYVKRPEDYARCRAVCEQRLGHLPAIYAIADICRPELLVEIEGVTFSPLGEPPPQLSEACG